MNRLTINTVYMKEMVVHVHVYVSPCIYMWPVPLSRVTMYMYVSPGSCVGGEVPEEEGGSCRERIPQVATAPSREICESQNSNNIHINF